MIDYEINETNVYNIYIRIGIPSCVFNSIEFTLREISRVCIRARVYMRGKKRIVI